MSKIRKNNQGVTLVELMIALAVLAMLMTAVIMLMSNNSVVYRKTKADINIQTTAQETFNSLQDSIMQASWIEISGVTADSPEVAMAASEETYGGDSGKSLTDISNNIKFYPTKMQIKYSVKSSTDQLENAKCTVTYYFVRYMGKANATDSEMSPRCNIYVTKSYDAEADRPNDLWPYTEDPVKNAETDNLSQYEDWLLTSSLQDAFFKIDAANQSVNIDLSFNDKGMTYHTSGIVGIRNSFVMIPRPSRYGVSTSGSPVVSTDTP